MFESQFGLLRSLKPPQDVSLCLCLLSQLVLFSFGGHDNLDPDSVLLVRVILIVGVMGRPSCRFVLTGLIKQRFPLCFYILGQRCFTSFLK